MQEPVELFVSWPKHAQNSFSRTIFRKIVHVCRVYNVGVGRKMDDCGCNNNNNLRTLITDMTDDFNISLPADLVRGDVWLFANV